MFYKLPLFFVLTLLLFACGERAGGPALGSVSTGVEPNYWEQLGLEDISVTALWVTAENTILAAGPNSTFRYESGTSDWQYVQLQGELPVRAFAEDYSGTIYALTGQGLLFSQDDGQSWAPTALARSDLSAMVYLTSDQLVIGGVEGDIFVTADQGNTWAEYRAHTDEGVITSFTVDADGNIFAGTYGLGVLRSDDNGTSWQEIGLRDDVYTNDCSYTSGELFVGSTKNAVYRFLSTTSDWEEIGPTETLSDIITALSSTSSGELYCGIDGSGVYRLDVSKMTWSSFNDKSLSLSVQTMVCDRSDFLYVGTQSGGVLKSRHPASSE